MYQDLARERKTLRGMKVTVILIVIGALDTVIKGLVQGQGGARGVMVIVVGNGHSDTSSNLGRDWLHFA